MTLGNRIAVTLFSVFAFAAWCVTALVINEGSIAADIIAVGLSAGLTFVAWVVWREAHGTLPRRERSDDNQS